MTTYLEQVRCAPAAIDSAFWRAPEGVSVPDDELRFLLVPDAVEALAVADVAQQVHAYQQAQRSEQQISCALMATMGGMLPGVLLYDHLRHGRREQDPLIRFGTVGVSLYQGPNEMHDSPLIHDDISIPVAGEVVLAVDDLGDRGGTLRFLKQHLDEAGARQVLTLVLYMKPQALSVCPADFHFGVVPQDTWIITPREAVETLTKRVPVWRARGADQRECRRRLVDVIGYPPALVDYYLPRIA